MYATITLLFLLLAFCFSSPLICRLSKKASLKIRVSIALIAISHSLATIFIRLNAQSFLNYNLIFSRELFFLLSLGLLFIVLLMHLFLHPYLPRSKTLGFILFIIIIIPLSLQAYQQGLPRSEQSFITDEVSVGTQKVLAVNSFQFKGTIPYLSPLLFYDISLSFKYNDELISKNNWPVRLIRTAENIGAQLVVKVIETDIDGFLPGFYQPYLIINNHQLLLLQSENPKLFYYNSELHSNLDLFTGR